MLPAFIWEQDLTLWVWPHTEDCLQVSILQSDLIVHASYVYGSHMKQFVLLTDTLFYNFSHILLFHLPMVCLAYWRKIKNHTLPVLLQFCFMFIFIAVLMPTTLLTPWVSPRVFLQILGLHLIFFPSTITLFFSFLEYLFWLQSLCINDKHLNRTDLESNPAVLFPQEKWQ